MKNLRKNADAQHLLDAHIPWYRTRKFWGITMTILGLVMLYYFFILISGPSGFSSLDFVYASGGLTAGLIGFIFFDNTIVEYLLVALYYVILVILFRRTFMHTNVKIIFPLLIIGLVTLGMVLSLITPI